MKYNLLCFQISARLIVFLNKHNYQVLTSLMKENKRYKRLKTAKWISIRKLVPGLLLTVRSAGMPTGYSFIETIRKLNAYIPGTEVGQRYLSTLIKPP